MNRYNFLETGGYPLETDTLQGMQNAYSIFNALGQLAGDLTIIKGCEVNGQNVSDGIVYIDGEVFRFVGGQSQTTVRIIEDITTKIWENGDENDWQYDRYVTFASGEGSIPWADFRRIESLRNLQSRVLPAGINPQLFSGDVNNIPEGWQLCDGTNGTPDLRGRFIVGYHPGDSEYNAIGNNGGAKQVALTQGQLPNHSHNGSVYIPAHKHKTFADSNLDISDNRLSNNASRQPSARGFGEGSADHDYTIAGSGAAATLGDTSEEPPQSINFNTNSVGLGHSHENRPPYYTLAYIIYTG